MVRAKYKSFLKSVKLSVEKNFRCKAWGSFAGMKAGTGNLIGISGLQFKCL